MVMPMLRTLLLVLAASCVSGPGERRSSPVGPALPLRAQHLASPDLGLPPFDTGEIRDTCTMHAPWGPGSWGVSGEIFTGGQGHGIALQRFRTEAGSLVLSGVETRGEFGFVRAVQGDVWGGGHCGPVGWSRFAPVPAEGAVVGVDARVDEARIVTRGKGWVLLAVNVWLTDRSMPEPGGDVLGRRPLVLDLSLHHECDRPGCGLRTFESEAAYHHQAVVAELAPGVRRALQIPVFPHVAEAARRFRFPGGLAGALRIYQVDLVVELSHASGQASLFRLSLESPAHPGEGSR